MPTSPASLPFVSLMFERELGIGAVVMQRSSGGGQVECHLVGSRSDAVGDMGRALHVRPHDQEAKWKAAERWSTQSWPHFAARSKLFIFQPSFSLVRFYDCCVQTKETLLNSQPLHTTWQIASCKVRIRSVRYHCEQLITLVLLLFPPHDILFLASRIMAPLQP